MIFDRIAPRKQEILWWEFCGLMHDIGKLSDKFLYYRQHWHLMKEGWQAKDPHDHNWLEKDEILEEFPALLQFFQTELCPPGSPPCATLSVKNAIHNHIDPPPKDVLLKYLQQGDRTDAKYDRNNPLFGCEQTNHSDQSNLGDIYRSNVFGYEGPETRVVPGIFEVVDINRELGKPSEEGTLNHARRELYRELNRDLQPYFASPGKIDAVYYKLRKHLKHYFSPALSDTTRPNNDTDLWDHIYSVASIAKAIHIGSVLEQNFEDKHLFRIWGFGFDALQYLANSHKIGDLLGRRQVLRDIFRQAKQILELDFPFGNCVYEDDNCAFFMTPPLHDKCFSEADEELRRRIVSLSIKESHGEIVPRFNYSEPVAALTHIVHQIEELRKKLNVPVAEGTAELAAEMRKHWANDHARSASICAVCRIRPAKKQEENKLLCKICRERRSGHTKGFILGMGCHETPLLEEIADQNGRVAMIVAKFGLRDWLNGKMIRTMFITQPDAIRRTITALDHITEEPLGEDCRELKKWLEKRGGDYNYTRMLEDLQACLDEKNAKYPVTFLYGRGIVSNPPSLNNDASRARVEWKALLADAEVEHPDWFKTPALDDIAGATLNLVCAKTPTPSTILDVWETTLKFFQGLTQSRETFNQQRPSRIFQELAPVLRDEKLLKENPELKPQPRHYIEVDSMPQERLSQNETMQARVNGAEFEVLNEGEATNRFWLVKEEASDSWNGKLLEIRRDGADWQRCGRIVEARLKQQAYYPYREIIASPDLLLLLVPATSAVAVTDAIYSAYKCKFGKVYGRLPLSIGHIFFQKYMPMFSVLDAARRMESNFRKLHEEDAQSMPLPVTPEDLTLKLGNGEEDWYHPYIETETPQTDSPGFFQSMAGPLTRISEAEHVKVKMHPNWYDSIFLGASAHRFDLYLEDRRNQFADGLIPLEKLLRQETPASIAQVWKAIQNSKITGSSLRNLEQTLLRRLDAWREDDAAREGLLALADSLLPRYFEDPCQRQIARAGIVSGTFFRALTLHLRIFKEKLNEEKEPYVSSRTSNSLSAAHVSR